MLLMRTPHICVPQTLNMCCVKTRTLTMLANQEGEKQVVFDTAKLTTIAASSSARLKIGGSLKGRRHFACVCPIVRASVRLCPCTRFFPKKCKTKKTSPWNLTLKPCTINKYGIYHAECNSQSVKRFSGIRVMTWLNVYRWWATSFPCDLVSSMLLRNWHMITAIG